MKVLEQGLLKGVQVWTVPTTGLYTYVLNGKPSLFLFLSTRAIEMGEMRKGKEPNRQKKMFNSKWPIQELSKPAPIGNKRWCGA